VLNQYMRDQSDDNTWLQYDLASDRSELRFVRGIIRKTSSTPSSMIFSTSVYEKNENRIQRMTVKQRIRIVMRQHIKQ
jgi:hypothetical protein